MGCWHHGYGWHDRFADHAGHWGERMRDRAQRRAERMFRREQRRHSSGNRAFDEYRMETLRRLEDEQREFMEFLDRLRMAKDKAEFDEFLDERRRRPAPGPEAPPPA